MAASPSAVTESLHDERAVPVAVGGVGGSGTRLVAGILRALGIHIGADLNASADCLWFTLLFKRREILRCDDREFALAVRTLRAALVGAEPLDAAQCALLARLALDDRPQHDAGWLRQRADSLQRAASGSANGPRWGWKEPNTHVVIARLWRFMPELRYVHVVRHGMEVAHGRNQNQLRFWGSDAAAGDGDATPARSLAFWCQVQRRMAMLHEANRHRMYWLDYNALCAEPDAVLPALCRFLGFGTDVGTQALRDLVRPLASGAPFDAGGFDPADVAYVRSLGYPVP